MKVRKRTDDAFRVMGYLSENGETNVHEMEASLGINEWYFPKILRPLCEKGWVTSRAGRSGGFSLAVRLEDITVLDLMEVMEETMKISPMLEQDRKVVREHPADDALYQVYEGFQDWLEEKLSSITLRDLLDPAG